MMANMRFNLPVPLETWEASDRIYHQRDPVWLKLSGRDRNATCCDMTPFEQRHVPFYPLWNGYVQYVQEDNKHETSAGNFVRLRHYFETVEGLLCFDTLYSHLHEAPPVKYNSFVYAYLPLGLVGNSGGVGIKDMSVHLHFEIHHIPYPDKREKDNGRNPMPVFPFLYYSMDQIVEKYPKLLG